jgi:glycosidase
MLAEWQSSRLHTRSFHAYYDWALYWLLRDIRKGKSKAQMIPVWLEERRKLFPARSTALQFTENHDYPRSAKIFSGQTFRPFAALTFLLPGLPLIYAGQEHGARAMPSLFEKQPVDWQNPDDEVFNFYKRMNTLYRSRPSLKQKEMTFLKTDNQDVLVIKCGAGERCTYALLNFSARTQTLYCAELTDLVGTDLLSGQLFDGADIRLDPYQVLIPDLVEDELLMI